MSVSYTYACTCDSCGATLSGTPSEMESAGWKKFYTFATGGAVTFEDWANSGGDHCLCKDCYDAYYALQEKADEAQQAAYDALGKFTPTPSPSGGDGSESNPYTFEAGVVCVLNAYYAHGGKLYVYMPADAEAKSYGSWEAAEADFAEWSAE